MKKIISVLISLLLILGLFTGCEKEQIIVRIAAVQDTACIALADMLEKNAAANGDYKYTTTVVNLQTSTNKSLIDGNCDIAFIPTDLASVTYKKTKGNITVLATISNVEYQILAKGFEQLNGLNDLVGANINFIERDRLDENLFEYVMQGNSISSDEYKIVYAPSVKQLHTTLKNGDATVMDAVGAAELKTLDPTLKTLNLNNEIAKISDAPMLGYCAVVSNEFLVNNEDAVVDFINNLEASVKAAGDRDATLKLASKHGLLKTEEYGQFIYDSVNINFLKGKDMQTAIKKYYQVIKEKKAALIGSKFPDEGFFYIPDEE